jgi:prepilin-type processing-associated H-X9-DG protein
VVISVILLLAALTIPAVASAREAARRIQCSNNLRQLGLAVQAYHDAFSCLPTGRMLSYDKRYLGPNPPCTSRIIDKSLFIELLPFVEQTSLYNCINQSLTIFGRENSTCHTTSVATLVCPSDPDSGKARSISAGFPGRFAFGDTTGYTPLMVFSSYAGCSGSTPVVGFPQPSNGCVVDPACIRQNDGVICDVAPIRLSNVADGLSNTVFLTEKATTFLQVWDAVSPVIYRDHGWYVSGNWGDSLTTGFYPPNAYKRVSGLAAEAQYFSASSMHPGLVNVVMGDGSVRPIKDTIDSWPAQAGGIPEGTKQDHRGFWTNLPRRGVWQALTTRAGGEAATAN